MTISPVQRIHTYQNEFTKTETELMEYILTNLHTVATNSIDHVAEDSGISKSAFVRFAKKIGYSGYAEFRFELSRFLISNNTESSDVKVSPIQAIPDLYCSYIQEIPTHINMDQVRKTAHLIQNSKRIKIAGSNRSFQSARQLKQRLGRIGYDSEALQDTVDISDAADMYGPEDLFIIFTISGKGHYESVVHTLHERGCPIVCITMSQILPYRNLCTDSIILPRIDKDSSISFLDNQVIFFVFIEILLKVLVSDNN